MKQGLDLYSMKRNRIPESTQFIKTQQECLDIVFEEMYKLSNDQ